ncbi:MAG: cytochrome c [Porticoccus sp.]
MMLRLILVVVVSSFLCSNALFAADSAKGQQHYQQHCSFCHGEAGTPVMGGLADFSRGEGLVRGDRSLKERIEKGEKGCPSYKGIMREREILDLISYLRTLY